MSEEDTTKAEDRPKRRRGRPRKNYVEEPKETTATVEEDNNVITGPAAAAIQDLFSGKKKQSNNQVDENGILGSNAATAALKEGGMDLEASVLKEPKKVDEVALYSHRNMRWELVGELEHGFNIVSKEAAEKWVTRNGVRVATPREVAKHFGKDK
jgi:hypothetical protein